MVAPEPEFSFDLPPRNIALGETPPTFEEMEVYINSVRTAAAVCAELEPIQHTVLDAIVEAYVGRELNIPPRKITPDELTRAVANRSERFRTVLFQRMSLVAMVAEELPENLSTAMGYYAVALGLTDNLATWHEKLGGNSFDVLMLDFARNGYAGGFMERSRPILGTEADLGDGWATVEDDPQLASRWEALEGCPDGSIGRTMFDFYQSRNFSFPGTPGSAPPLLAQHDWVHVLGDYGTTLPNEIEVFSLISAADVNPQSFSLLTMVIGLFGTGRVPTAAGLFEADSGHIDDSVSVRIAEALRRGGRLDPKDGLPTALLEVDWFALADRPLEEVRDLFGIEPKRERAQAAGSVGPWEEDGFSDYQKEHGDLSIINRYN
jgi:hypothetical protein